MITIVDYGMGNVNSIYNMLKYLDIEANISRNVKEILNSDKIILPGVGAFDCAMTNLNSYGLVDTIKEFAIEKKKPILGICLGMQLLGKRSEEGQMEGLSILNFESKRFTFPNNIKLKIPHMGWDIVSITDEKDPLVYNLNGKQRYYFVHSYFASCESDEIVLMRCEYGFEFAAAVRNNNVYGVQFHPEKSHVFGMNLLRNFAGMSNV